MYHIRADCNGTFLGVSRFGFPTMPEAIMVCEELNRLVSLTPTWSNVEYSVVIKDGKVVAIPT